MKVLITLKNGIYIILRALWRFFKGIHSNSTDESAKRFYGGILVTFAIVLVTLTAFGAIRKEVWITVESTVNNIMYTGASLLGVAAVVDIIHSVRGKAGGLFGGNKTSIQTPGKPPLER